MKHYNLMLAAALCVLCCGGCTKKYVKHWDLEVDSTAYTLSYTDGSFPLFVWCSGSWQARFENDEDWIRIQQGTDAGRGNGIVRIEYRYNEYALRSANLIITSGDFVKTVVISQKYDTIHLEAE